MIPTTTAEKTMRKVLRMGVTRRSWFEKTEIYG